MMTEAEENDVRSTARSMYADKSDDNIEVDEAGAVLQIDEGYWVQAWLFVRDDDVTRG